MKTRLFLILWFFNSISLFAQRFPYEIDYLSFIENKGQWNKNILFSCQIPNGEMIFQDDFIGYVLVKPEDQAKLNEYAHEHLFSKDTLREVQELALFAFKVNFLGANTNSPKNKLEVKGHQAQHSTRNYFKGSKSNWASGVKSYQEIEYEQLYPKTNLKIYKYQNAVKYEFVLEPHASPENIQLQYEGVESISIENEQLIVRTSLGVIREDKPYAYTIHKGTQTQVSCKFKLEGNLLTFELGKYNEKDILVIDPQLIFSTYSGSYADNWGNTACLDNQGSLYTGGTVFYGISGRDYKAEPTGFPATIGAFQQEFQGGDTDIGILKFDSSGQNLVYATYIGGSGTEIPSSTITNKKGELFVLAITSSKDFPVAENAIQKSFKPTVPELDWYVNNKKVASNYVFSSDTLKKGDLVYAVMKTTDFLCSRFSSVRSNILTVGETPKSRVLIDSSHQYFCPSSPSTFRAHTINSSPGATFEWFVNKIPQGVDDTVFVSLLKENDTVFCVMKSATACGSAVDTSNYVTMKSLVGQTFSTTIFSNEMPMCTGGTYTLRAKTKPSLPNLAYQWQVNSVPQSRDSVFEIKNQNEGTAIKLIASTDFTCLTTKFSSSNIITISNDKKVDIALELDVNRSSSSCSDYFISVKTKYGGSTSTNLWLYNYFQPRNIFRETNSNKTLVWEGFSIGDQDLFQLEVSSSLGCVNQQKIVVQDQLSNYYDRTQFDQFSISTATFSGCKGAAFNVTPNSHEIDYASVGGYIWQEGTDILVLKLSKDGSQLLASTYLGGSRNDGVLENVSPLMNNYGDQLRGDISVDEQDNVYIVSSSSSKDFPIVNGFQQKYGGGLSDAVVVKLAPQLDSILWSSFVGGNDHESGMSIVRDTVGRVFITGGTTSSDFKTTKTLSSASRGGVDAFIAQISENGNILENAVVLGTTNFDQGYFIQKDHEENLYVLGQTKGDFPVIGDVYSNKKGGVFIQKLTPNLDSVLFSTVIGDTLTKTTVVPNISPTAFLVNRCGNLFISGWGGSTNNGYNGGQTLHMPLTANTFQPTSDGSDFYMMVLHKNADSLLYATYFGGPESHEHVDGGTSRFDDQGIVYQSVCAGCGGQNDFPIYPPLDTDPTTYPQPNNSGNCNNGVFKFDLANLKAAFTAELLCKENQVIFKNTTLGGVEFEWKFGDGNSKFTEKPVTIYHKYEKSGRYTVKLIATDLTTCIGKDSAEMTIELYPELKGKFYSDTICQGDSIQLVSREIENRFTYKWTPSKFISNDVVSNPIVWPDSTMSYFLTITDDRGCSKTDTFLVTPILLIDSISYKLVGSCQTHPQVQFRSKYVGISNLKYKWDFGDGEYSEETSPIHQFEKEGEYKVVLNTENRYCRFKDEVKIPLSPPYIPNIFTPNQDGKNETFYITNISNNGNWSLDVYNRWGKRVYYKPKYTNEWDGGNLSDATYFYLIVSPDGSTCKGWVQIVR